ncbi:Tail Collar domain protein [Solidesulfovibrio carbinoliphilus subsp. oakridgensis]|uniref:Tail Collar domain protein n=1 Tax=Solidesulfovibrio carbinoliphilus subsp. oakridgensis TaxID=694327 RepID=G7QB85_9BACT|nr:tail fiber protein [Solidesulfovibrio carbinoliphilus]EHJ48827.1 Tail Collar domain protein [Solidesulfovibrio carbinoliphilus subsp. oakridgensis]
MKMLQALILLLSFILSAGHSLAGDGSSFNPVPIPITSQGTIPVGTVIPWPSTSMPADATRWLECNGQAVPSGSQYDRLRVVLGSKPIPNYNGQFLRGTTVSSEVGQTVADSTRAHDHLIDAHQHTVSGTASGQSYGGAIASVSISGSTSSQSYSGTIAGQHITGATSGQAYGGNIAGQHVTGSTSGQAYIYDIAAAGSTWWPATGTPGYIDTVSSITHYTGHGTTAGGTFDGYTAPTSYSGVTAGGTFDGYTSASNYSGVTSTGTYSGYTPTLYYSGNTSGGTINGVTNYAGGGYTHQTGGSETAPVHTKVRYLIRAIP